MDRFTNGYQIQVTKTNVLEVNMQLQLNAAETTSYKGVEKALWIRIT
jgi:hypothetical protein